MDVSWMQSVSPEHALAATGAFVRVGVATAVGGLPLATGTTSPQVRLAAALALAIAAWPAACASAPTVPAPLPFVIGGEALVGLGLGVALAAVFAAAGWAGAVLGSVSGLSWSDDFTPDAESQGSGITRLAWWLGLAGFISAGGHLELVAGLVDSFRVLPVGAVAEQGGFAELAAVVSAAPGTGLALALALAGPALAAVLVFHVAATVAVRVGRVDPGQGLLQSLASVVVLAGVCVAADAWIGGFTALVQPALERCFLDLRH